MIARISTGGKPVAEMDDDGVWQPLGDADNAPIAKNLNIAFNPNDPLCRETGDHHLGYGRACAGRAATEWGFEIEFSPQEPLPDGAIS